MEAGTHAPPTAPRATAPRLGDRVRTGLEVPLDMLGFALRAVVETRGVWRYTAEIMRQAGMLIMGTTLLLLFLQFVHGSICGIFGNYGLRAVGASDAVGAYTGLCTRHTPILVTGYVVAAKVGCGLVAEIGSMKISDELDAFRSVGLNPMRFVVATRLVALWLVLPFWFFLSQLAADGGAFAGVIWVVGEVPQGPWEQFHWALRSPLDLWRGLITSFTIATGIVLAAMYYGYRVPQQGPVAVGAATARSMVVNLVLIYVLYLLFNVIFYGSGDINVPLGG